MVRHVAALRGDAKNDKEKFGTKSIALMGVLIAVVVVFSRFLRMKQRFKISFTFIPESLIGMIFGPFGLESARRWLMW